MTGSQVKVVLWRNYGQGTVTEIVKHPGLPKDIKPNMHGPAEFLWHERELLMHPELARRTVPNYPRIINVVKIDDGTSSDGTCIDDNANLTGAFPGKVRRYVGGSMSDMDDCWVYFPDGRVKAIQGDYYIGRLSGIETLGGTQKALYVVGGGMFNYENVSGFTTATEEVFTNNTSGCPVWVDGDGAC